MPGADRKLRVLFLCTGNSCRSQMAEGWARALRADSIEAHSAGTQPHGLNPLAVRAMAEAGVDISAHTSKRPQDIGAEFDVVVTVCDSAHEACPVFPGARVVHVGFDDPPRLAAGAANDDEAMTHYRRVRDEIRAFVETLPGALALARAEPPPPACPAEPNPMNLFERRLTLWVALCILGGVGLGRIAPNIARTLDGMSLHVGGAPVVSIPIAVCLFFMMYPIMVKIDFARVVRAGRNVRPVLLTLVINWAIKPFTMYAIALLFLGTLLHGLIGADAVDWVKVPFGLDLPLGATHGAGTVVMHDGAKMLEIPLWRSYLAGCILLGVAPCTAMVLVWGNLARGNDGLTLVMVAVNSLAMLVLYGLLGGFLLGVGRLPVPWQALLLSISIYVALPLVAGYFSRRWLIRAKGERWFKEVFLRRLNLVPIAALLLTLVLLFSLKGDVIASNPLTILWIAIPLFVQTILIFALGYAAAKALRLSYEDAVPAAMIGASNHFEVAIATAVMLFGLSSGAALATVVGVLIEVPLMLALVGFCKRTARWFSHPLPAL